MTCEICDATTTNMLCPLCQETLNRAKGTTPGGLVAPYLFHFARYQRAMKERRDTEDT